MSKFLPFAAFLAVLFLCPCLALAQSSAPVVFLGDSMLFGFLNFPEYIPKNTVNMAVTTSMSSSVAGTASSAAAAQPRSVFIMTGVNDIAGGSKDTLASNYDIALTALERSSPQTRVYAEAIFPVNWTDFNKFKEVDNVSIRSFNEVIKGVAGKHANTVFLDFTASVSDAQGNLRREISADGLHLNAAGYELWGRLMGPYY